MLWVDELGLRKELRALFLILFLLVDAFHYFGVDWLGRRWLLLQDCLLARDHVEDFVQGAVKNLHAVLHVVHVLYTLRLLGSGLHGMLCSCTLRRLLSAGLTIRKTIRCARSFDRG